MDFMISNFPEIVKKAVGHLPKNDYPVMDSFTFVSCWLSFILDQSLSSMRDLFKRLEVRGKSPDISTFSKASKTRDPMIFHNILIHLRKLLRERKGAQDKKLILFPIDSTIVSLTSKLLWMSGYHKVKLFCGINSGNGELDGIFIHFGQGHDSKYGEETIKSTPEGGLSIMDRGFCKLERVKELQKKEGSYFLLRLNSNVSLEMLENGKYLVGSGKERFEARVIVIRVEGKSEFRLITNLPEVDLNDKGKGFSDEEIGELYRQRWQIELLWKFLKMHLKLDRLITKNSNGITIQIYSCLIGYILLQLVEVPKEFGEKLLDKLRYLQAFMCENISYVHWFKKLVFGG